MKIGNIIEWNYGGRQGRGFCIGEMSYSSEKGRVICLADEQQLGFPVALRHCKILGEGDFTAAVGFRRRYEQRLPGHLKVPKKKAA